MGIIFDDEPGTRFEYVVGIQVGVSHRYVERGRTVAALDRPRELHVGDMERAGVEGEVLRADLDNRAAHAAGEARADRDVGGAYGCVRVAQ